MATRLCEGYIQAKPVIMTILKKFVGGLNGNIQERVCSKNPRRFEEAFEMARKEDINLRMCRRQGGNEEWRGNEKIPKYLEDTIARLGLATINARESMGNDDVLTAFSEKKSQPDQNQERKEKGAQISRVSITGKLGI